MNEKINSKFIPIKAFLVKLQFKPIRVLQISLKSSLYDQVVTICWNKLECLFLHS